MPFFSCSLLRIPGLATVGISAALLLAGCTVPNTAPQARILAPSDGTAVAVGTAITATGYATDAEDPASALVARWLYEGEVVCADAAPGADSLTTCSVVVTAGGKLTLEVTDTGGSTASARVALTVDAATGGSVTLDPPTLHTDDVATAVVAGLGSGETVTAYRWSVNGAAAADGDTLDGARYFDRDDEVSVAVDVSGPAGERTLVSDAVTVVNTAPGAPEVAISPSEARQGDTLSCNVTTPAADADADAVAYTFAWTVDGAAYEGATDGVMASVAPGGDVDAGQRWACTVTPTDGRESGATATAAVTIGAGGDADGDGYIDAAGGGDDCDDTNEAVHPGAREVCDAVDNDCDGAVDAASLCHCPIRYHDDVAHPYQFCTPGVTWPDAEAACEADGYHLVTLNDADEEAWVHDTALDYNPYYFWIGFNDRGTEGRWEWVDGSAVTYTNWGGGEPSNSAGNEDCAHFVANQGTDWNDLNCETAQNYVCEAG